jgi:hypothetical protein
MASVIHIAGLTPRAFAGWLGTDFVLAVERSKRMLKAQTAAPAAHVGLTNLEHSGQNRFRIAFHSHRAVDLLATFLPKPVSEDYALAAWPRLS